MFWCNLWEITWFFLLKYGLLALPGYLYVRLSICWSTLMSQFFLLNKAHIKKAASLPLKIPWKVISFARIILNLSFVNCNCIESFKIFNLSQFPLSNQNNNWFLGHDPPVETHWVTQHSIQQSIKTFRRKRRSPVPHWSRVSLSLSISQ